MKPLYFFCLLLLPVPASLAQTPAGATPERLLSLRGSFERALERVTAPVRVQYRDELIKLKTEYTKAGNLEAALAVENELKERFPAPPPISNASSMPGGSPMMAKVNVKNSVIARLVKGEKLYTESEYIWLAIPETFAGLQFAQPKNKHTALTEFSVETDGLVYVAFISRWQDEDDNKKDDIISRRDVERMGWKILKAKTNLISDEAGYEWIVCAKECKAGESFALRTDKYCAPIVLTK
jgi:hypothetical protein